MVYIIQCNAFGLSNQDLELYRDQFARQIKEGVLVLPCDFELKAVLNIVSQDFEVCLREYRDEK